MSSHLCNFRVTKKKEATILTLATNLTWRRGTQTALPQDSSIGSCANIYDAATTAFDQVPGTMATTGKVVACVLPDVYVWGLGDVRATQLMKNG